MNRYVSNTIESNGYNIWLLCNMNNESDICCLASSMIDVLTRVCGKDEDELEQEWMSMSFDRASMKPNLIGAQEFFDEYADEVLESLWSLDESSYSIFDFVEKEEITKPNYGSCDDGFASAMFPVKESVLREGYDDFPCDICGKESEDVMGPGEMFEFDCYMDHEDGSMQSKISKCATKLVLKNKKYTHTMMCPDCFEKLFWNPAKAMCAPRKKKPIEDTTTYQTSSKTATPKKANVTPKVKVEICLDMYNQLLDVFKASHDGKEPIDFYIEDSFGKYGGPGSTEYDDDYECNYDWGSLISNEIRSYTLTGLYPEYNFTDNARNDIATKIYNAAYRDIYPGYWSIHKGAPESIFKRPEVETPVEDFFKKAFNVK